MNTLTAALGTDRARRLRAPLTVLLAAAVAGYLPFYFAPFQVFQLTMVLLYAVALSGLNLLVGFGGQISLGHGAFFAAGAYTAAVMLDRYDTGHLATLPVAAAGCFLLGLGFGVPALRLRGLYLALVTLSFAVFLPPLLKRLEPVTGGSMGLTVDKLQPPAWSGLAEDQWMYFVVLAVTAVALLLARNLLRSRVGRALRAVRDNESAAEVMGVRLSLHKTYTKAMHKYAPDADPANQFNAYGWAVASSLHKALDAMKCPTREGLRDAVRNLKNVKVGLLLPGVAMSTGQGDAFPIETMQLMRFKGERWQLFGKPMDTHKEFGPLTK